MVGHGLEEDLGDLVRAPGHSVAALSSASGVSNGSIYHHFGSKQGVLVALLVEIVRDYQHEILAVLGEHPDDARTGVLQVVAAHLRWTEDHRDQARLLIDHRTDVASGPGRRQLRRLNANFRARSSAWLNRHFKSGALEMMPVEVAQVIVYAPAQEVCRLWLSGRGFPPPTSYSHALGHAAWAGLRSVSAGDRPDDER